MVILVDHQFQALSRRFQVGMTPNDEICDLKEKVQLAKPVFFSRLAFDNDELVVWKPMGEMVINKSTSKRMAEILRSINANSQDAIQELEDDDSVADLGLSGGETLLLQVPGTSRISTIVGHVLIQV
jgi:hypothetical protein